MSNFYETVIEVLKQDNRFFTTDGVLLRNAVYEAAMQMDTNLIHLLLTNDITKERFFKIVDDIAVFDKVGFGWVVNNREFLPDSYTRFKNKIGLVNSRGDMLSSSNDVELVFPYKDCVLEFDSTDTNSNRKEIFYNETLAKNEIDRLFSRKVLTNAKRISKDGEANCTSVIANDNLLIKGNNLLVLYSLLPIYRGRIKCMYWDILYNTDNDAVPYNDSFKHSSWLVMMKNRLEVARNLLRNDGLIFLQCDDKEMAYLKVLCDEIFTRNNGYINTITVKTKVAGVSGSNEGKSLIDATEFVLVYAKNKSAIQFNPTTSGVPLLEILREYEATGKSWKYTTVLVSKGVRKLLFEDKEKGYTYYAYENMETMSVKRFAELKNITVDEVYLEYYSQIYRTTNAQSSVRGTVVEKTGNLQYDFVGLEYVPTKGRNAGKKIELLYKGATREMVTFLSERIITSDDGPLYRDVISTIWSDIDYNNLKKEGGVELPFGKKPEKLVSRIIDICVNDGDIVLDAYSGTGTTAAIAHKRNLKYIAIEQLDEHINLSKTRLHNVINGDQTGISQEFNWQGGGSYVYCELAKANQNFVDEIQRATNIEEIKDIYSRIIATGFISCKVNPNDIDENAEEFYGLSLDNQKKFLMELLDKNLLYVNYCDIDDEEYGISEDDKAFTRSFYGEA